MSGLDGVNDSAGPWIPLLAEYHLTTLPHEIVLRGSLRSDLTPASPEVVALVETWKGSAHLHHHEGRTDVVLVYGRSNAPQRPLWVHAALLVATLFTTLAAGAMLLGLDPFETRVTEWGDLALPYPTVVRWGMLAAGATFAVPLLSVLLVHEMGHFAAARRHRVRATLPFFIPFPPYFSIIGTVGAFIRLESPTVRRSGLFDIGAAGPLASFVLSLPLLAVGLAMSRVLPADPSLGTPFVIQFAGQPVWLGSGLLTGVMARLLGPEGAMVSGVVVLHPLAFAGWLGLFVTALNLLPLGQLDGGHILYALLGDAQGRVARAFLFALVPLGLAWWGWWGWAALVLLLHKGRTAHPPVLQPEPGLDGRRRCLAWAMIGVFFLTFVPIPLAL